jgi:CheY-like chemotaxis protein
MARILVVDDEARVRALVRRMLESAGFEVEEVAQGWAAVPAYRACPVELVLCDLFMPGVDGVEVIGGLLREFPGVMVVAMSGWGAGLDTLVPVPGVGAVDTLSKSFTQAQLLSVIHRTLQNPQPA